MDNKAISTLESRQSTQTAMINHILGWEQEAVRKILWSGCGHLPQVGLLRAHECSVKFALKTKEERWSTASIGL